MGIILKTCGRSENVAGGYGNDSNSLTYRYRRHYPSPYTALHPESTRPLRKTLNSPKPQPFDFLGPSPVAESADSAQDFLSCSTIRKI